MDNPISRKPLYCHLWTHCLLLAQHEPTSFIWNNKKVILKPGQFVTGRKKLSEITGISESSIEKILKYLESEQQITQEKTTKFRIITIKNWDSYQQKDNNTTTKRQQGTQQKDTYKNVKNVKNAKKQQGVVFSEKLNTEKFLKVWEEWIQHRTEIRHKLTPKAIEKQLKLLEKYSVDDAVAILEHSILNDYQGLFPDSALALAKKAKKPAPSNFGR